VREIREEQCLVQETEIHTSFNRNGIQWQHTLNWFLWTLGWNTGRQSWAYSIIWWVNLRSLLFMKFPSLISHSSQILISQQRISLI